jgi:hypothetical protein
MHFLHEFTEVNRNEESKALDKMVLLRLEMSTASNIGRDRISISFKLLSGPGY